MSKAMFITGGSRGIGRAVALLAAEAGWDVAISYRSDRDAAEQTCQEIEQFNVRTLAVQGDVASAQQVERMFEAVQETFGTLHSVIVNAGIVGPASALADMSIERIDNLIKTNVLGALYTARLAAQALKGGQDHSASLVFVSSAAARLGSPHEYVDYAASKGALDTLTIGLSKELAAQNIRVNAVRPGLIETDIHASGGQPDRAYRLGKTVPLSRPGSAEEVARTIVWLCRAEASYVTGALLDVAGGR